MPFLCLIVLVASNSFSSELSVNSLNLYRKLDESGKEIVCVPAFGVSIPKGKDEEIYSAIVADGKLKVTFLKVGLSPLNNIKTISFELPAAVNDIVKHAGGYKGINNEISSYFQGRVLSENDEVYLPLPSAKIVFSTPLHSNVEAITPTIRKNIAAAIVRKSGVDNVSIIGINIYTKAIEWEFPIKSLDVDQRLYWINDHLLLSTTYGRKSSGYAVIDLSKKEIVAQSWNGPGINYIIRQNFVFAFDPHKGSLQSVFQLK